MFIVSFSYSIERDETKIRSSLFKRLYLEQSASFLSWLSRLPRPLKIHMDQHQSASDVNYSAFLLVYCRIPCLQISLPQNLMIININALMET